MHMRKTAALALASTALGWAMAAHAEDSARPSPADTDAGQAIVVTGSRGQARTVTSSPTPIDVIGGDQLARLSGGMQLRDALTQLVPSFQAQQVGSSSWDSVARPAGLRGLSGVDVLVLVNGKRRHNSAMANLNTGNLSPGGNPVDLDQIPASAIKRIEVLRDGAAAQYGSDAIAGVINIILKDAPEGGEASLFAGQRYPDPVNGSDGKTISASVSHGFHLGSRGSIVVSVEGKVQDHTVRNSDATSTIYGKSDPREATANRRIYQGGLPLERQIQFAENASFDTGDLLLYSNATFGYRYAQVGQAGRVPASTSDIIAVYPNGYTPYYTMNETDFQATAGMKGKVRGWDVDLSTAYGRDYVSSGSMNTLNASLGASSPTSFKTFSAAFDQWTTNLDITRGYEVLGGRHLQVSAGAEFRYESYVTKPLDPLSYANGGYVYPTGSTYAGQYAAVGAQGATLVTPSDAANLKRTVWATYLDTALDVTSRWLLTGAVRFEQYDDSSGSNWSGKVSTLYKATGWLNLRAAFSNGFRAPSLTQQGFQSTSDSFTLVGGTYQLIESKTVQPGSAIGQALGATPLKPETSHNTSFGFTLTPLRRLSISVDAYQIDIHNRVALTGYLSGSGVSAILTANGYSGNEYVRYFTNAINTRTRGLDVVANYNFALGALGDLHASVGYNHNVTNITHIAATPSALSKLGLTLFDRQAQGYFTAFTPKDKIILGLDWQKGRFGVNVKETRYGAWWLMGTTAATDQHYGAKWISDLELSYDLTRRIKMAVGAQNLFNVYPDKNTVANTIGSSIYGSNSPFGAYGGFYYARVQVKL
ncbi:MAG TPA: TonB-dependent receptor [Novosphingobium sp.]|nr:TonB-dependent receptor [Novosphingobium sp.]